MKDQSPTSPQEENVRVHVIGLLNDESGFYDVFFPSAEPDTRFPGRAWVPQPEFEEWASHYTTLQIGVCQWIGPAPQEAAQN